MDHLIEAVLLVLSVFVCLLLNELRQYVGARVLETQARAESVQTDIVAFTKEKNFTDAEKAHIQEILFK